MKCPACNKEIPDNSKFCNECGYSYSGGHRTGQLNPDTILENRYIIVKTLGQGGMGAVYLALDTRLNNIPVAIKEMSTRAVGGDLQAAIAFFKKEASILLGLHHQSLPVVRDFFAKGEERWYLVMDFVEGQTLAEVGRRRGALPEGEVLDWARQLCEILDYLHKQHPPIIFRDLKPENIMLTPQGQIKLIDFGIARHFRDGNTTDTSAYGSKGFAPPEQGGESQTDARADVYALGATLHCLLTGKDPAKNPYIFEAPSQTVRVSPELDSAIMKALEFRVEDRPGNMREMLALLPGGSEISAANNVGKKPNQSAKPKNAEVNKSIPAQEFKTAPISTPVDINMAEGKTASIAGGAESNTIPMDSDQIQPNISGNTSSNSVSTPGSQPDKKPNKTRNIIIAICLFITMITGGAFAYIQSTKVVFHDAALEKAVRKVIHKPSGTIYESDVENIRKLDLSQKGIKNISALKDFTKLRELILHNNQITDIRALSGLHNLEHLEIYTNRISNISSLSELTNLKYLDLDENKISDISGLSELTKLETLFLANNQITDINTLSGLTNLTYLSLSGNSISDISTLSRLAKLDSLYLNGNQISDLSALSGLTNLVTLYSDGNQISDINILSGLTNLQSLSLTNNQINDTSALSGLTNLVTLYLDSNQVTEVSALSGLTNLQLLYLDDNQISDISALAGLTNLTTLYLGDNSISDYSPIQSYYGNLTDKDFEIGSANTQTPVSSPVKQTRRTPSPAASESYDNRVGTSESYDNRASE